MEKLVNTLGYMTERNQVLNVDYIDNSNWFQLKLTFSCELTQEDRDFINDMSPRFGEVEWDGNILKIEDHSPDELNEILNHYADGRTVVSQSHIVEWDFGWEPACDHYIEVTLK